MNDYDIVNVIESFASEEDHDRDNSSYVNRNDAFKYYTKVNIHSIENETEKAYLMRFSYGYCEEGKNIEAWIPKSIIGCELLETTSGSYETYIHTDILHKISNKN